MKSRAPGALPVPRTSPSDSVMSVSHLFRAFVMLATSIATILVSSPAGAQRQRSAPPSSASATPPYNPALYTDPSATNPAFKALRWRLVGPYRGGRVDAVAGDPTKPLVHYFGAVNGPWLLSAACGMMLEK